MLMACFNGHLESTEEAGAKVEVGAGASAEEGPVVAASDDLFKDALRVLSAQLGLVHPGVAPKLLGLVPGYRRPCPPIKS